jgi:uncharacterized protein (DUF2237 family)
MRYSNIIILFLLIVAVLGAMTIRKYTRKNRKTRRGGSRDNFQVQHKNILGNDLQACSIGQQKITGYYRNGYCSTGPTDTGTHVVCARMDDNFLEFTKSKGNDLITPRNSFPGLVAGDRWCICAHRWTEAYNAGKAPKIFPDSTSDVITQYTTRNTILNHAVV